MTITSMTKISTGILALVAFIYGYWLFELKVKEPPEIIVDTWPNYINLPELVIEDCLYGASGHIQDQHGNPIEGAKVIARTNAFGVLSYTTKSNGWFSVSPMLGCDHDPVFTITVSKQGFTTYRGFEDDYTRYKPMVLHTKKF